uniref:G protein-coupled receptor n=1 Tax=Globodera rostochiensis TaxID=31243 RepID=A0A914IBB4_GLORO
MLYTEAELVCSGPRPKKRRDQRNNFRKRLDACIAAEGTHFEHLFLDCLDLKVILDRPESWDLLDFPDYLGNHASRVALDRPALQGLRALLDLQDTKGLLDIRPMKGSQATLGLLGQLANPVCRDILAYPAYLGHQDSTGRMANIAIVHREQHPNYQQKPFTKLFLFRHAEYERLYNCTGIDVDSIPLERRQFVPESIAFCVLSAIYYVLYVPCMYSFWKHLRDNSCYNFLFYIGIVDLIILSIAGFFCAWANLRGAVFCSYPTLMYLVGVLAHATWSAETSADLILAFNRCLELVSPRFSHILFTGHRASLWITGCSLYALFWALFMNPVLYSSIYFAWFYYPFVGYRTGDDQLEYEHWLHRVHNTVVAFLSPLIYLIFVVKLFYDIRKNRRQFGVVISEMGTVQIRIFTQVFFVSLANTSTCFLYVYIQSYEAHQWMITLAEFAWLHVHGLPPVIYLALNKTIREDCRLMFMKLFLRHRIGHIGKILYRDVVAAACIALELFLANGEVSGRQKSQVRPSGEQRHFDKKNCGCG